MKKNAKTAAVFGAAAVLSAGAAFTSLAAWQQEGDSWIYTDSRGDRVTDSWRQSGKYYYYLDNDGNLATDQWIDDTYYVDVNGVRVSSRWVHSDSGDNAPSSDGGWFYLGTNGKVVTDSWQTINGRRYHFDSDGRMSYGWLTDGDNLYYLGDENDGAAKTGWLCLDYSSDVGQGDGEVASTMESGGTWFYFQNNGRSVKSNGDSTYVNRTINGHRYYFNENGEMATGWVSIADRQSGDGTGVSTLKYFGGPDEGQMARGWRYLYDDPEDTGDNNNNDFSFGPASPSNATPSNAGTYDGGDGAWYYFGSNGTPEYLSETASSLSQATTRINGHRYFFDSYGRMQSGLLGFTQSDGTVISAYFGADDSDGAMKTNRQTNVIEEDGERSTFYFNNSGSVTGSQNGYLYYQGKLVQAESGENYQVFEVDNKLYLVNESGKIQTSNRAFRASGEYRYEYDHGTIYYINDNKERIGEVTDGSPLPESAYKEVYTLTNSAQ